jgi:hypothetical protein
MSARRTDRVAPCSNALSKDAEEQDCYRYLLDQMGACPNHPRGPKADFKKTRRRRFHVKVESFEYCWRESIEALLGSARAPAALRSRLSAVLHHADPRVTLEHYNRATSLSAAESLRQIVRPYEKDNLDSREQHDPAADVIPTFAHTDALGGFKRYLKSRSRHAFTKMTTRRRRPTPDLALL